MPATDPAPSFSFSEEQALVAQSAGELLRERVQDVVGVVGQPECVAVVDRGRTDHGHERQVERVEVRSGLTEVRLECAARGGTLRGTFGVENQRLYGLPLDWT